VPWSLRSQSIVEPGEDPDDPIELVGSDAVRKVEGGGRGGVDGTAAMTKVLIALDDSPILLRAAREAARLFPDAEFLVVNMTRRTAPHHSGKLDFLLVARHYVAGAASGAVLRRPHGQGGPRV
jgi:hypothetical protein